MSLFQDANIIMQAALHAALPDTAVEKALKELPRYSGKLVLIAAGKAAWQMAHAAYAQLGAKIDSGVVITKHGHAMGPSARWTSGRRGIPCRMKIPTRPRRRPFRQSPA